MRLLILFCVAATSGFEIDVGPRFVPRPPKSICASRKPNKNTNQYQPKHKHNRKNPKKKHNSLSAALGHQASHYYRHGGLDLCTDASAAFWDVVKRGTQRTRDELAAGTGHEPHWKSWHADQSCVRREEEGAGGTKTELIVYMLLYEEEDHIDIVINPCATGQTAVTRPIAKLER
jgi:hypothetical protein